MFNLSEAWKRNYEAYLAEEYANFDKTFDETFTGLEEAQKEVEESLKTINEYFELYALSEGVLTEDETDRTRITPTDPDKKSKKESGDDIISKLIKDTLVKQVNDKKDKEAPGYSVIGFSTVEKIGDMKFPQNVFFFIRQLVDWIKRVVVYFVEKIKNLFRMVIGDKPKELNKDYVKLALEREKEVIPIQGVGVHAGKTVNAYRLDPSKLSIYQTELKEGVDLFKKSDVKDPVVITIDLNKELLELRQLVAHFFNLFDNAYGSNNEHLFGTEDLKLVLDIFKEAIKDIKKNKTPAYEVGESMVEVSAINSARVKETLVRTKTNVDSLSRAYLETANMVNSVAKIINNKELLMTKDMGVAFRWLTSTTLSEMVNILNVIKPRLKQAAKLEKDLDKMQTAYSRISSELQSMQSALIAVSNITYTTVYQRRIADLYSASRYMTQIVTLRLAGIGSYIKELKDIQNIIGMLAVLNDK